MDPVALPTPPTEQRAPGRRAATAPVGDKVRLVRTLIVPPLRDSPTAREVLQHALAEAATSLFEALERFEASCAADRYGPVSVAMTDDGLRQARLASRRLDGVLRVFCPLLASSWIAEMLDDLDRLRVEIDRAHSSEIVRDRLQRWEIVSGDGALVLDGPDVHPGPASSPGPGSIAVLAAAEQRLSLDLIAMHDLLGRPSTVQLLDRIVVALSDPRMAPQADDPADEQLLTPVARSWRRMARRAKRLPSQKQLVAGGTSSDRWNDVVACRDAALRAWTGLTVLAEVDPTGADQPSLDRATKKAKRLHRLTSELSELQALQVWLNEVAVGAHGQTAFAAGRLADVAWRESKPSKKPWNKARRSGAFGMPAWLR